ncbi:ricin-type beta-trefoil lectin domain protein [Niveibacterium sp. SC-1]|uniref:ricin-type beta-trefoil lectin domain protein n=1 Tax=Niveibacterium sp. SC-1 TaxID=3135646 RepID=UPI00311E8BE6
MTQRLAQQPDIRLGAAASSTITLNRAQSFQTIDGFGASFTDTSNWLIGTKLNAAAKSQVLKDLFAWPSGAGFSVMRVPMGASDFAVNGVYSYADSPDTDALAGFSTGHDDAYVIPVIKEAQATNPSMRLFANPWSPPAWMKTNGLMLGSWNGATLKTDKYQALANYFVKFLKEYSAKGVNVWGVTPQNEPNQDPSTYPGMVLSASDEVNFIANYLAPSFDAAGLSQAILGGDVSYAASAYASTLYANATVANRLYGTAWHCYQNIGGFASGLSAIHAVRTDKPIYSSECSTGPTGIAGNTTEKTLVATNNWSSAMVLWNLALDRNGGPKMGVGCEGCTGLVTIDQATGEYEYTINYYELAQFSKFVRPRAVRIGYTDGAGIWAQAYRNADGSEVLVAYNTNSTSTTFTVNWGGDGSFSYTLPSHATVTFTTAALSDGGFGLKGEKSQRCLNAPNGTMGAQLQVADCDATNPAQRLTVSDIGELRIMGRCAGAAGDQTKAGTKVILWTCNGKPSQKWVQNSDGTVTNPVSGLVLDVANEATANGSPVHLWTPLGTANQRWSHS